MTILITWARGKCEILKIRVEMKTDVEEHAGGPDEEGLGAAVLEPTRDLVVLLGPARLALGLQVVDVLEDPASLKNRQAGDLEP